SNSRLSGARRPGRAGVSPYAQGVWNTKSMLAARTPGWGSCGGSIIGWFMITQVRSLPQLSSNVADAVSAVTDVVETITLTVTKPFCGNAVVPGVVLSARSVIAC